MFKTTDLHRSLERLKKAYDEEWLDWLPETLRVVIKNRWNGIGELDFDRLMAMRNLINLGWFWHDVDIFEATVNAFNWISVDHRACLHPGPGQIVYAVSVAGMLDKRTRVFSDDVAQYIAGIFLNRGYVYIPEEFYLKGVQRYIDIYTGSPEFKEAVESGWKLVVSDEQHALSETSVDIQLARLLAIKKFVDIGGTGSRDDIDMVLAKLILT